ncbi:hypothetical protein KF728_23560 [Candidatus Obscuribacterales bacterium]|nr:hypothetical protein [Candidatus Obscuribacterales bacterium]MBX3153159.1 hypothetical protein [Candidatus Obscuribacterales bacterium]
MVSIDDTLRKALREHRNQWLKLAVSCDELNVPSVQDAVKQVYALAGYPPPERLVWLDSPLAGAVAASIFNRSYENLFSRLCNQPVNAMYQKLWRDAANSGTTELWQHLDTQLKMVPLNVESNIASPIRAQVARQLEIRFSHRSDPHESQQVFNEDTWSYILMRIEQQLNEQDFDVLGRLVFDANFAAGCAQQSWYCGLGGQDGDHLELLSFADVSGVDLPATKGILALSREVNWWWVFDKVAIVTYRPQMLVLDSDDRLHNNSGPAVEYNDSWCIYARHGKFIPERVIRFAHRKNLLEIDREQNIEVRRHLIEVYGVEQYLKDAEAVKIDEDSCGVLYRKDFLLDEPLKMVKVLNSSPEPDGTFKYYFLRVPPNVMTAREAVAWTFGMSPEEYHPEIET